MSEMDNSLVCTLCLGLFNKPKILPCFHTYCEDCLMNLESRLGSKESFPCPSCRESTKVPPGGVSHFQSNFYIKPAVEVEKKKMAGCTIHADREFVAFCLTCDLLVCVQCMLREHKQHQVQDISDAVQRVRKQLAGFRAQLQESIGSVGACLAEGLDLQHALKDRNAAQDIRERHSALVAVLDKQRDKALMELEQLTAGGKKEWTSNVTMMQERLEDLHRLNQRIEIALATKDVELLITAKEINTDSGCLNAAAEQVISREAEIWEAMLYQNKEAFGQVSRRVFQFIGLSVVEMIPQTVFKDVFMQTRFRCPRDRVFCVCPCENGDVWVSYHDSDAPIQKFSSEGQLIDTNRNVTGTVNLKSLTDGKLMCTKPQRERIQTYAKSHLLMLDNGLKGEASVEKLNVKNLRWKPLFTIRCGSHLAFDANDSAIMFAVLEHETHLAERSIQIFRKPEMNPVFSFLPSFFRPVDFCFLGKDDKEVFLVADKTNRSVQTFVLKNEMLCFSGTLADISRFSASPSALNTDCKGKVWIGTCQGLVISCETSAEEAPIPQKNDAEEETIDARSDWSTSSSETVNSTCSTGSGQSTCTAVSMPTKTVARSSRLASLSRLTASVSLRKTAKSKTEEQ